MIEVSAVDSPAFKAIDGSELLAVLIDHLDKAIYEVLMNADGKFTEGRSFPVASVHGVIRIGL